MENRTPDTTTDSCSGPGIDIKEIENILLSHECVEEAHITSVPDGERRNVVHALVTLEENYLPSNDMKRELAWHVITQADTLVVFKDIEFREIRTDPATMFNKDRTVSAEDIYISGHKVNTGEVERALLEREEVVDVRVMGIPDKQKGAMLSAFITLRKGVAPTDNLKRELAWHARLEVGPMVMFRDMEFGDIPPERSEGGTERGMVIVDEITGTGGDIHISSHRISTTEVTRALLGHQYVEDAAVVTVPDEDRGEIMKAFVKLRKDVPHSNDLKLELAWHVMTELKPISVFKSIQFESETPVSAGKETSKTGQQGRKPVYVADDPVLSVHVERVLASHESVSEAIVIGVPDESHGEALKAFVTLENGIDPSDDLREELAWHTRTSIGPEVVFKSITFRRYLPRATTPEELRSILKADELEIPTRISISIAD
jgi:acyl-coenzyme A synthetase/AMP-(fatty) acid ligase